MSTNEVDAKYKKLLIDYKEKGYTNPEAVLERAIKTFVDKGETREQAILEIWRRENARMVTLAAAHEKVEDLSPEMRERVLAFAYIQDKINETEFALRNFHWFFLGGIGVFLAGLFVVWLWYSRTTIFYGQGGTRYVLGVTYAITGALFAFLGLAMVPVSINIRLRYPEKLKQLKGTLEKMKET